MLVNIMKQIQMNDPALFNGLCVAADWIDDLESSNSRTHKEQVIEKALIASQLGSASAQCFLYNCYLAYNPFYVYGVRQVAETQHLVDRPNPWVEFWALLESLRTRSATGNTARDNIEKLSQQFDSEQWNNVCRRVIVKDLRCGISEKTLNRVLKNTCWAVPVFQCQLAQDSGGHPKHMVGTRRLEVKLDGVRVLAFVSVDTVTLYSRNGKPLENFPQVQDAISRNTAFRAGIAAHLGSKFVLDGEIVGKSFQELMRQTHRKSNAVTNDAVFHMFDVVPFADFQQGHCNQSQLKRLSILQTAESAAADTDCLRVMPGLDVDLDTSAGHDTLHRFANDAVDQGFEGIMIKNLAAPYECRRSAFWLKWKPFIEVTLEVVDVEQGTGRNQGRLGAFICAGQDDGKDICVNVGSGFSDDDRSSFWHNRSDIVGHLVEIRADAVTQNQNQTYSLRFPRFLRFRGFEPGEKL